GLALLDARGWVFVVFEREEGGDQAEERIDEGHRGQPTLGRVRVHRKLLDASTVRRIDTAKNPGRGGKRVRDVVLPLDPLRVEKIQDRSRDRPVAAKGRIGRRYDLSGCQMAERGGRQLVGPVRERGTHD